jgi:hypothetical protein
MGGVLEDENNALQVAFCSAARTATRSLPLKVATPTKANNNGGHGEGIVSYTSQLDAAGKDCTQPHPSSIGSRPRDLSIFPDSIAVIPAATSQPPILPIPVLIHIH